MSLPQAVKSLLHGITGVSDSSITFGSRNQGTGLPCVTYTLTGNIPIAIGSNPIKRVDLSIRSTALTAEQAQDIGELVEDRIRTGTWNGIQVMGVYNLLTILEDATPSLGDEAPTYSALTTAYLIYR